MVSHTRVWWWWGLGALAWWSPISLWPEARGSFQVDCLSLARKKYSLASPWGRTKIASPSRYRGGQAHGGGRVRQRLAVQVGRTGRDESRGRFPASRQRRIALVVRDHLIQLFDAHLWRLIKTKIAVAFTERWWARAAASAPKTPPRLFDQTLGSNHPFHGSHRREFSRKRTEAEMQRLLR